MPVEALGSRKGLHEQRVGILGMAFKGDSDDKRESRSTIEGAKI